MMHEGPVAALLVQQQRNRHIHPQALGVSLADLQGQVPLLTQSSSSRLKTMSEPVPLLHCAPEPMASHAQKWKELNMDISSVCSTSRPNLKQNGHCECSSDMTPGAGRDTEDLGCQAAGYLKHCGAVSPQQRVETPISNEGHSASSAALDERNCKHLPASVNASEDCSSDLLRIVKHKPSAIVFCDNDGTSSDNQVIFANESSDSGDSSSSASEAGEGDDDDEEDDFAETLRYKEFLVSRQRRNSSRNRKGLRKRQDVRPKSSACGWQKPTNEGKPELTGSQEEQDAAQNNGKQVRKTRQEEGDNKHKDVLFTVARESNSVATTCYIVLQRDLFHNRYRHSRKSTGVANNNNNGSVLCMSLSETM